MPKDLSSEDIRHFPLNLSGLHLHKNSADPFPPSALSYPVVFPLPSSYIPVASNLEDRAIATPEVVRSRSLRHSSSTLHVSAIIVEDPE